eukprot:2276866-Pleurochrysis_carterae.AAC.1
MIHGLCVVKTRLVKCGRELALTRLRRNVASTHQCACLAVYTTSSTFYRAWTREGVLAHAPVPTQKRAHCPRSNREGPHHLFDCPLANVTTCGTARKYGYNCMGDDGKVSYARARTLRDQASMRQDMHARG